MAIHNRMMYFGTRGYMQWVPACAVNPDFSKVGWSSQMQYLNGGVGVRSSSGSHKEYQMTWNSHSRDALRPISDYADGMYDTATGVNLLYFLDPVAMDKNVLPYLWSVPSQGISDGLTLTPGQDPTPVLTPTNSLGYPARSAVYKANLSSSTVWIPIPAGYTLWLGAHGSATGGAGVVATPTSGTASLTPQPLTMLSVTSTTRFNKSIDSTVGDGVILSLANLGSLSTATVTLSGLMAQVLPTGVTPASGGFISGQGNSGCQFADKPTQTPRSAALDKIGMTARLIETGAWL